ncbi:hypothetical protein K0U83_05440 [bacterium]|nr:hypothetical protein [bacterium]
MPLRFWGVHDEAALASVLVHDRGPVPFGRGVRFGGAAVIEEMPPEVVVPLFIVLTAAVLFQRRRQIAAWLGFEEKK